MAEEAELPVLLGYADVEVDAAGRTESLPKDAGTEEMELIAPW